MRIAIGGIMHESNTFNSQPTDRNAFEVVCGDQLLQHWQDTHHEVGGFIEAGKVLEFTLCPTLMATATPGGPVTDRAFEYFVGQLLDRIEAAGKPTGLLLALHGAMVTPTYPDGDGEILRRLRDCLGPDFPIVTTLDHHANVSQQMVDQSTVLVIYKTNPHVDQRQRGLQAAQILARILREEVRPTQVLVKPPMILPILYQNTARQPMATLLAEACRLEQEAGVLVANVAAGYGYADVYEVGPAMVVVTENNAAQAQRYAEQLSARLWQCLDQLAIDLPDAAQAVRQACSQGPYPTVLVDMGDNIGGGSPGDSTIVLEQLLLQRADRALVVLCDPEAVDCCLKTGVRQTITLEVGAKTDQNHGTPVTITGRIRAIHDGLFEETEPRHGGRRFNDQGLTAVVETESHNLIVLTSYRQPPFSLQQILSLGLDPRHLKILVVKAAIAFRAAYEPIAARIIEVDTPGLTAVNPNHFTYQRARRPLFPLDPLEPFRK